MILYGISDLHLSFESSKPMDVFRGWENYIERIRANWERLVSPDDAVVLPGDFSWALHLQQTQKDFAFLSSLPGKKILLKGNHDLWWSTCKKVREFWAENNFSDIELVYNSCCPIGPYAICGTRGWVYEGTAEKGSVVLREAGRLETSLRAAETAGLIPIVFLHYPPVWNGSVCRPIWEVLLAHGVDTVYHGHIHGNAMRGCQTEYEGIRLRLLSCDCVDFTPVALQKIIL